MPNQKQFDTTLQSIRNIDCKLFVLDYDYTVLDEISGKTESVSLSVDAESDIRRTANINIALKDDSRQTNSNIFYWQVGNPYWFDKYIQIYVAIQDVQTQEFVWVNEGIYMVNSPSISYDATTNNLSFEAVDLMSKMTGLRNGQLEGMTYTIPVGSTITGALKTLLVEQGFDKYIIFTPPYDYVPQEIKIDIGGTAYDLLCELRDINANWEMFFDVDGVFHFQQIPSGKVIVDPIIDEEGEPTPVVDQTMWDKLNVSYELDTSFEDVKNYVEVLGKVHEPHEYGTVTIDSDVLNMKLTNIIASYLNNEWIIGIPVIATEGATQPEALATPINRIVIKDISNASVADIMLETPIIAANEYYCVKLTFNGATCETCEYLGALQPRAIAFENNPESPFYVGTSTQYESAYGNVVDFASENEDYIVEFPPAIAGSNMVLNLSPWCTASNFNAASIGDTWKFKLNITLSNQYLTTMSIIMGGSADTYSIRNMANQQISLDYSQDYLLIATKISNTTLQFNVMYYPMPASVLPMSTTSVLNLPKFNKQVRMVCAGDEYDNIYSDSLAEQRARYEIYLRSRVHDSINVTSVPIYWLEVNDIIEYNLPNSDSETTDLWLVKSVSTDISTNGTQSISAIRYYPLYADISMTSQRMR
jgi:hypothetical protein